uniref:Fibulin 5 n=1 Tax=Amphilophus citrinellus TaxID=61819 RepID=A0A3Q0SIJ0_AMPCI
EGFAFERRTRQCIDVDECRILPDACRGDMRCVNQNGGYLCIPRSLLHLHIDANGQLLTSRTVFLIILPFCPLGRSLCNINECETNSHHCNPTQLCINSEGGYTCSCQLCANIPGSYSCSCNPGFILNPDSRTCQDVDECADEPCSHGCFNTYGSYMCNCNEGFELASDGTTCIDLDECSFSDFLCQYRCVNTPGSFSCICPPAYYVHEDGRSCEGKKMSALGPSGLLSVLSSKACISERPCIFQQDDQTSNVSATLVLSRPIRGPKEVVLDLEMVTVNNVINFRGSSIIRLTIFVSEHPF